MFAMTSMGGKIDHRINNGRGPYIFRLNSQNHHRIGTLLPADGVNPSFAQLYFYDTDNEVPNRINAFELIPFSPRKVKWGVVWWYGTTKGKW